jgi:hypothetical protein
MISAPHPFIGGGKEWQKGIESNSNLASVFGIQVRPIDGTSVPYEPVEIHIKDWGIPPYSPHSRAEVLAATIHCLLLSCHATPDHPLDIRIITKNKNDHTWAEPFAKEYVRLPGEDGKPVTPTPVGDSFIKTDGFGIQYVMFRKLNPKNQIPKIAPVILPMEFDDDGTPPGLDAFWPGTGLRHIQKGPIQSLDLPRGYFYNVFSAGPQFSLELNPLFTGDNYFSIESDLKDDVAEVMMSFGEQSLRNVTSAIASAALTAGINHGKPMKISVYFYKKDSPTLEALLKTPGWEKTSMGYRPAATSAFDYDPNTKKLTKGTLPGGVVISSYPDGRIYLKQSDK